MHSQKLLGYVLPLVLLLGQAVGLWAQEATNVVIKAPIEQTFIESIIVEEIEEDALIKIQANQEFNVVDFVLFQPPRLVIEVVGSDIFGKKEAREIVNAFLLKEINMGYFVEDILANKDEKRVDYMSFRFGQNFSYDVRQKGKEIQIWVRPIAGETTEGQVAGEKEDPLVGMDPEVLQKMVEENPELAKKLAEQESAEGSGEDGAEVPGKAEDSEERKKIKELKNQDMEAELMAYKTREKKAEGDSDDVFEGIQTERVLTDDQINGAREQVDVEDDVRMEGIENVEQAVADKIEQIREDQEKTETGLIIPKENSAILDILDQVQERRKEMLFFEKEAILRDNAKQAEIKFEEQMGQIVGELQRYTPLVQPGIKKISIDECIQVAINNHLPAQIALEKIKLAKLKYWEARRNIFPKVSTDISKTKGEAGALPFSEEDYKITVDYALFDGGEIKFLLKQAKVNLEVAKRTYDKIKTEVAFDVEEAYYNHVMAKMNLATQRRLLGRTTDIVKKVNYLHKQGLVRLLDFRNVKSSYNQVQFQVAGTVKDYEMGELSLRQKMSVGEDFTLDTIDSIGFKDIPLNIQDALWLAYKYRSEYIVNKLMVDFQNFDRLANIAKESFRVDFSCFYGYGGGAYQNDTLHLNEQWNAALKVSKSFGGNTVETNVIKEHAFPRLGQSSRGDSYTRSLKVSLLDNLKVFTDKKQADITFQEAVLEVGKMEKQIETDVRNACYDYQKAIIQIDSAFDKVLFREEEVKVNKTMMSLGEATAVQMLDSYVRLSDEKSFYFQGLINYYIAIANLNKAIGLIGYYR